MKYPLKDIVTDVNGNDIAIMYKTLTEILPCRKISTINGDVKNKIMLANTPKTKLKKIHFLIAILAPCLELIASSSETSLVAAKVIPELASVMHKKYTDITKLNIPIPSEPITFAK